MGCTGDPAVGVYGKLLLADGQSPYTWDETDTRLEILPDGGPAENVQKHGRLVGGQGIWGDVYPLASRVRTGGSYIYGQFRLNPSPGYFDKLLPYLVGDEAADVFTPKNCLNWFGLLIYRDDHWAGTGWEIADCRVASWELTGRGPEFNERQTPDLLTLQVNVIAKTENPAVGWPASEPPLPEGEPYAPYIFQDADGEIVVNGSAREVYAFSLKYDTGLRVKYPNSLTPKIYGTKRKISLGLVLPWDTNNDDLHDMSYIGAPAALKFVIGSYSTLFSIRNFKAPAESPFIKDENEVAFAVEGQAYGTAAEKEFSVTSTGDMSATMSSTPSASVSSTPSHTASKTPSATPSHSPSSTPSASPA